MARRSLAGVSTHGPPTPAVATHLAPETSTDVIDDPPVGLAEAAALVALFLLVVVPAAALAARGRFDGLYGQDPYAYYDYAVGALRDALRHLRPPPPFHWPPGYPLLVALAAEVVGARPLAGQLVSLVAGGLVPVCTALLAREVWPARAAWRVGPLVAGLLAACGGQLWQSSFVVMSDTTGLAAATAGMWALARYRRRERAGWLLLAAGALAWAVLTRWGYALVVMPATAYALLVLARRGRATPRLALAHGAAAALVVGLLLGPLVVSTLRGPGQTASGEASFGGDLEVFNWHPLNALHRRFVTADGLLTYRLPNGPYYALAPARPTFFTPLLAWLIVPGLWGLREVRIEKSELRTGSEKAKGVRLASSLAHFTLLTSHFLVAAWAAIVCAFHAGAIYQNIRYVLAYTPPCAILIAIGLAMVGRALGRAGAVALGAVVMAGLVWMIASGVGLAQGFIARKDVDLAVVRGVQGVAPPDARLLTFGPTLAFQHYTAIETRELSELGEDDLARLAGEGRPLLLLVDTANLASQWEGRAPATNTAWLRAGPGLVTIGRYGAYTLFRVGGP